MDKKNIIVASIWLLLFFVTIITQTSQMVLSLLFTLFVLTFSEEIVSKYINNKVLQKISSSILSIITILIVLISLYYAITIMAKDLIDVAHNSQDNIIKKLSFLGINNIDQLYKKFIEYINNNLIVVSGSAIVLFKVIIGFILGFVFHFSTVDHKYDQTLEAAIINDLRKYGNKIFISFRNIIEIQVIVAILNTIIISTLAFGFYLSGETLPFWYIIIPLASILSLIPVVGNILINLMLALCTIQISFVYLIIGLTSFLIAHKLELILIGKKIKEKIDISFILVLLSMLLGELLFHSMSGMLLGMVIVLSLLLIAREIKYPEDDEKFKEQLENVK